MHHVPSDSAAFFQGAVITASGVDATVKSGIKATLTRSPPLKPDELGERTLDPDQLIARQAEEDEAEEEERKLALLRERRKHEEEVLLRDDVEDEDSGSSSSSDDDAIPPTDPPQTCVCHQGKRFAMPVLLNDPFNARVLGKKG